MAKGINKAIAIALVLATVATGDAAKTPRRITTRRDTVEAVI